MISGICGTKCPDTRNHTLFWFSGNCRGGGENVVFVAREARHEHHIYSLTTAVPKEPLFFSSKTG